MSGSLGPYRFGGSSLSGESNEEAVRTTLLVFFLDPHNRIQVEDQLAAHWLVSSRGTLSPEDAFAQARACLARLRAAPELFRVEEPESPATRRRTVVVPVQGMADSAIRLSVGLRVQADGERTMRLVEGTKHDRANAWKEVLAYRRFLVRKEAESARQTATMRR